MKKRVGTSGKGGSAKTAKAGRSKRAAASDSGRSAKPSGRSAAKSKTPAKAKSKVKGAASRKKTANAVAKKAKPAPRKKSTATRSAKTSKAIAKPLKSKGKSPAVAQPAEKRPRKVKTYLTAKELREFKELLLQKRAELAGDVRRLTSEALDRKALGGGDHSSMPIHMADLGSDNWEQDFTLGLIANEAAVVRDIDEALARIQNRTYGICMATQNEISPARLRAKPWAKYCIEYAREREAGRAP